MVDNYLVFGTPQESGPSGGLWGGWEEVVMLRGGGWALEGTVTSLAVFIMHSANTTLQHLAGGNVGPNKWAFVAT